MTRPPRCVLVNVSTGESIPSRAKLQVNWNRQVVPGLSHQVLEFQSTSNRQLTGVEFYLYRFFATEQPGDPNILEFRAFLRALTVPPAVTEGVLATAPPPVRERLVARRRVHRRHQRHRGREAGRVGPPGEAAARGPGARAPSGRGE